MGGSSKVDNHECVITQFANRAAGVKLTPDNRIRSPLIDKCMIQLIPASTLPEVCLFLRQSMTFNPSVGFRPAKELRPTSILAACIPIPRNNKRPIADGSSQSGEGKVVQIRSFSAGGTAETL